MIEITILPNGETVRRRMPTTEWKGMRIQRAVLVYCEPSYQLHGRLSFVYVLTVDDQTTVVLRGLADRDDWRALAEGLRQCIPPGAFIIDASKGQFGSR